MLRILLIIYIIYKLLDIKLIGKVINVILPFILAFVLAYSFYPLLKKLNKKLPKVISIMIIIGGLMLVIFLFVWFIIPLFIKESNSLFKVLIVFIENISIKYNIDLSSIISKMDSLLNYKNVINGLSISVSFITNIVLCFISFIYLLIDIDRIELKIKSIKNRKIYNYISLLDKDVRGYLSSLIKISIISFFEYTLAFLLIGHDDPLLMGVVAGIGNMIPYIGSVFVLIVGILTGPDIIIKVSLLYFIMGLIDSYLINPYIYGKYNSIHPVIELLSISIGGALLGFKGIIFALPITIIVITTYNYFKDDLTKIWGYLIKL